MTYSRQDFRDRVNERRQDFDNALAGFAFGVGLCVLVLLAFIVATD